MNDFLSGIRRDFEVLIRPMRKVMLVEEEIMPEFIPPSPPTLDLRSLLHVGEPKKQFQLSELNLKVAEEYEMFVVPDIQTGRTELLMEPKMDLDTKLRMIEERKKLELAEKRLREHLALASSIIEELLNNIIQEKMDLDDTVEDKNANSAYVDRSDAGTNLVLDLETISDVNSVSIDEINMEENGVSDLFLFHKTGNLLSAIPANNDSMFAFAYDKEEDREENTVGDTDENTEAQKPKPERTKPVDIRLADLEFCPLPGLDSVDGDCKPKQGLLQRITSAIRKRFAGLFSCAKKSYKEG